MCTLLSEGDLWDKIAPTSTSDASTSTMSWRDGSGLFKMGVETKRLLSFSKASRACSDQQNHRRVEVRLVRGRVIWLKPRNEPPVKIGKPQKSLDHFTIVYGGPISNRFYLGRIHPNPFWRQNKHQKRN